MPTRTALHRQDEIKVYVDDKGFVCVEQSGPHGDDPAVVTFHKDNWEALQLAVDEAVDEQGEAIGQ
jgi:hypothetical protein